MANEIKTINDIFLCDVTARADIAKIVENYASKIYVDDKISNLGLNINLDSYATKTYVRQLITNSETKINISLNDYSTKSYVDQEINKMQNEITTLKQIVEELKNNGGVQPEEPEIIYGNIITNITSLTIDENNSANFTIKLDKAPTQQQIVNISVDNNNVTIDKTNLTFTSDNYNVEQIITATGVHNSEDYSNKTAVITINSNNVSNKTISVTINNIDIESTTHNMLYTIPNGITIDNTPSTVENNSSYTAIVKEEEGYELSSISVIMGGIDITSSVVSDYNDEEEPTVYNMLYNISSGLTIDNKPSTINADNSYTAIIREEEDYELSSISVIMAGIDITDSVVSDYNTDGDTVPCTEVTLNKTTLNFTDSYSQQLVATVTPTNTTDSITWTSSDSSIVSVNNTGYVTPKANGHCEITVTCGNYSASCSVTVNVESSNDDSGNESNPTTISCTEIKIDQNIITFTSKEEKIQLNAIKTPTNCNESVLWSSVDSSIAEVTSTGLVTPIGNGITTINAICGTKVASCGVQVDLPSEPVELPTIDIVYDNPTLTIVDNKLKAEQNGIVQYFDVSYEKNSMHPHYADFMILTDPNNNNETYYIALTSRGLSPFGKNGNHIDSGGWYNLKDSLGNVYVLGASILAINNFNGNIKVKNVNVEDSLIDESLRLFNQGFPMLNFTVDDSSLNTIEYNASDSHFVEYESSLAYEITYEDHFKIVLHPDRLKEQYGSYNVNNKKWFSTLVHELGHTLGASDYADHHPSIMTYERNLDRCLYLQPNDIAFIKYLHQTKYGVDIPTIQEDTNPYKTNSASIDLNNIDLEAIKENIKNDPTIGLVHYYNPNIKQKR